MEKVLTVVVPTYNMEDYLDRCLTSLITDDEHMSMLEVLVINDGSKDRSSEIAHSYEAKHPGTFKVIDKENGNYGSCVNKGMEIATGKYFRILDADDWFDTEALVYFIDFLKHSECDCIFTSRSTYYSDGKIITTKRPGFVKSEFIYDIQSLEKDGFDLVDFTNSFGIQMHQTTFLLSIIKSADFKLQHGISYTDSEYCYFPCRIIKNFCVMDIVLYQYNLARDGQTMNFAVRKNSWNHLFLIARRMLADYVNVKEGANKLLIYDIVQGIVRDFYRMCLLYNKKTEDIKQALHSIDTIALKDKEIYNFTHNLSHRYIKFVAVWRRFGLSYRDLPFRAYDKIWDTIKRIVK